MLRMTTGVETNPHSSPHGLDRKAPCDGWRTEGHTTMREIERVEPHGNRMCDVESSTSPDVTSAHDYENTNLFINAYVLIDNQHYGSRNGHVMGLNWSASNACYRVRVKLDLTHTELYVLESKIMLYEYVTEGIDSPQPAMNSAK